MAGVSIDVEVLETQKADPKEIKLPNCWICNDTGVILYHKKSSQGEYEYAAHCVCQAGDQYRYNGQQCKEYKSLYYTGENCPWKADRNEWLQRAVRAEEEIKRLKARMSGNEGSIGSN